MDWVGYGPCSFSSLGYNIYLGFDAITYNDLGEGNHVKTGEDNDLGEGNDVKTGEENQVNCRNMGFL